MKLFHGLLKALVNVLVGFMRVVGALCLVAIVATPFMGRRTEYTDKSRERGCRSNLNSLNKALGVWESQNIALPVGVELWIEFATDGKIVRTSPGVDALMATGQVPTRDLLKPGSTKIYDYTKDTNVFACPQRSHVLVAAGDAYDQLVKVPEVHYRFVSSPKDLPELGGGRRGVVCLFYGEYGPRSATPCKHSFVADSWGR